eukprot:7883708-Lingulodinium_polyedra.AAC.1
MYANDAPDGGRAGGGGREGRARTGDKRILAPGVRGLVGGGGNESVGPQSVARVIAPVGSVQSNG